MASKIEYWAMFGDSICSRHGTATAAQTEATACEQAGGAKHAIYKVQRIPRKPTSKKGRR